LATACLGLAGIALLAGCPTVDLGDTPTEIGLITGSLVREAERRDVPVPLHHMLYALVRGKEASWQVPQELTEGQR
jgi:hypothetical protein